MSHVGVPGRSFVCQEDAGKALGLSEGLKSSSGESQRWDSWAWRTIDFMCKAVVKCSVAFWGHAIANTRLPVGDRKCQPLF